MASAPLCCVTPAVPPEAFKYRNNTILLSLDLVTELRRTGEARAVVDLSRKVNLLVAHTQDGEFIALNRSCTHGGAQCTYNHRRKTVRCTSLNHAEYDLQGTLLHGRTHGNLRSYVTRQVGEVLEIELGDAL